MIPLRRYCPSQRERVGLGLAFARRAAGSVTIIGLCLAASCHAPPTGGLRGDARGPLPPAQEPVVRVRIAQGIPSVTLAAAGGLRVSLSSGGWIAGSRSGLRGPLTLASNGRTTTIRGPGLRSAVATGGTVLVQAADGGAVRVDGVAYPGSVLIRPVGMGQLDVINRVPLEEYLPGVLDKELMAGWHAQTFAAQAVAARSYALCRIWDRRGQAFDLEATQSSQMYGGASGNARAAEAVARTRGQALVYGGRVLPAYYSSASGGSGQDASAAFPSQRDLPPLRGRNQGAWDIYSPQFHWGPILRDRQELSQRFVGWGRANGHPVGNLTVVSKIVITRRNAAGRPTQFAVTDAAGRQYLLGPEQFRFACNYPAPGLAPLAKEGQLKSSLVNVRETGRGFSFEGRGYGHGVGLSQWGAQNMAQRGYEYRSILAFYYPGAGIVQGY